MSDWRLQGQEQYLTGVLLVKKRYRKRSESWDHDHCKFCWRKFSERPGDLNEGYATEDEYYWICENCYGDFREQFRWTVKEDEGRQETWGHHT
jgi:hypothetical protein